MKKVPGIIVGSLSGSLFTGFCLGALFWTTAYIKGNTWGGPSFFGFIGVFIGVSIGWFLGFFLSVIQRGVVFGTLAGVIGVHILIIAGIAFEGMPKWDFWPALWLACLVAVFAASGFLTSLTVLLISPSKDRNDDDYVVINLSETK